MSVETVLTSMLLSRSALVEAAHLALRILRFRDSADRLMKGLEDQAKKDQAAEAALKVLEDIQRDEKQALGELSDEQANQYAKELADLVQKRVKDDFGVDEISVEGKLKDIRSTYR